MVTPLAARPRILIVGAGISGLVLANRLGDLPADVLVLDQAMSPARRRNFPGIVSAADLCAVGLPPDLGDSLPIRRITQLGVGAAGTHWAPEGLFAIEHGRLLDALLTSVEGHGVSVIPRATITGFLWNDGGVAGVQCVDGASYSADLVVLADEASPRLAESLGLRPDWPPTDLTHIGKRRYVTDPATVSTRLGTDGNGYDVLSTTQPASWEAPGWGLVFPGVDSISVAVAMSLEEAMASARHISEYLDEIEALPAVRDCIAGLSLDDYVTEVVPTGGFAARHRFHADGVLVLGDLVGLTHPLNRDGLSTNLDVCAAAARTIAEAISTGDFGRASLRHFNEAIAEDVIAPVTTARRADRRLGAKPAWTWASKPELLDPGGGVTAAPKSATLTCMNESGILSRLRGLGRKTGARRSHP